jgi:hypothetical protein
VETPFLGRQTAPILPPAAKPLHQDFPPEHNPPKLVHHRHIDGRHPAGVVDQDASQTVTMQRLTGDHYTVPATMPLAWVLNTVPADHDLG